MGNYNSYRIGQRFFLEFPLRFLPGSGVCWVFGVLRGLGLHQGFRGSGFRVYGLSKKRQAHIKFGKDLLDVTTSPNEAAAFTGYHSDIDRSSMTWMMNLGCCLGPLKPKRNLALRRLSAKAVWRNSHIGPQHQEPIIRGSVP